MAFAFGLLHGFGFAGALSEIGLPAGHIPVALLFFNVGVEIGQLLFVAVVLSLAALVRLGRRPLPRWARTCAALPHRKRGHVLGDPARVCFLKSKNSREKQMKRLRAHPSSASRIDQS